MFYNNFLGNNITYLKCFNNNQRYSKNVKNTFIQKKNTKVYYNMNVKLIL